MNNLDKLKEEKERLEKELEFTEQTLKNRLKDEKERFQKQLYVVEQQIKDWEKPGVPKEDTVVYLLTGDDDIVTVEWSGGKWNWEYWKQGNVFLIFDEAIAESKRRAIHHEIKTYANKCNGKNKIDWENPDQVKFFISVSRQDNKTHVVRTYFLDYPNQIYFLNDEDAEKCIELIGKQRLLKDYFLVTI